MGQEKPRESFYLRALSKRRSLRAVLSIGTVRGSLTDRSTCIRRTEAVSFGREGPSRRGICESWSTTRLAKAEEEIRTT